MVTRSRCVFKEIIFFLIPLFVSSLVFFYKLDTLPDKVGLDEIRISHMAASLNGAPYTSYYARTDAYKDTHGTLLLYQILFSFIAIGQTIFALRFIPVLYGVMTVVVFYLFLKEFFASKNAVVGALILALSWKFISLTRWTNETSIYTFFLLLCIFTLTKLGKSLHDTGLKKYFLAVVLGLFAGLLQQTYSSSRVFVPIIPLSLS